MVLAKDRSLHVDKSGYPIIGSYWRHGSGRLYTVLMVTNQGSADHKRFPPTVCFQGQNGLRWSRAVIDFLGEDKFRPEE